MKHGFLGLDTTKPILLSSLSDESMEYVPLHVLGDDGSIVPSCFPTSCFGVVLSAFPIYSLSVTALLRISTV